ncbi:MAG: hypothetical protein ACMXYD_05200 [Candidatus Woesearchaeota archaeon]
MAPLSPSIFVIAGATIAVISLLATNLRPFVVLGGILLLIGAIKAFFNKKTSYRTTATKQPAQITTPKDQKRCFVCGAKNHSEANFCGHCGHKLEA